MRISRISGHWGQIEKHGSPFPLRHDEDASLPFSIKARLENGTELFTLPMQTFAVTDFQFQEADGAWKLTTVYEGAGLQVNVSASCQGDDALEWTVAVENHASVIVEAFQFPLLYGVQCGGDYRDDSIAWLGYLRSPAASLEGYRRTDSGQVTYFDLYDSDAALYVGVHDSSMLDGKFHMRPFGTDGPYDFEVEKYCQIHPGQRWQSGKSVLAVHEGDWHYAADTFYRPWYEAEMPKVENPAWVTEDFTGFVQFIPYSHNQLLITSAWRMAKFHGWNYLKAFLCDNPGPDFIPEYGGVEAVARNAGWIRKHDGQVDSYTDVYGPVLWYVKEFALRRTRPAAAFRDFPQPELQWRLQNRELPLQAVDAPSQLRAQPDWNYWPRTPHDYHFCLSTAEVHEYWQDIARRYAEANMNMYWDESGNTRTFSCHSPLHQHIRPGSGWSTYGRYAGAKKMIEAGREVKPDFVITGENYNDRVMSVVNIPYFQDNGQVPFWDEVVRYTHPDHIYNAVIIKMPELIDRAFLFHARISSSDIFNGPGCTSWLRARVLLSQAVKDVSYRGRYLDNVGITVEDAAINARWVILNEPGNAYAAINIVNYSDSLDGRILVELPADFPEVTSAFAYMMEGRVKPLTLTAQGRHLSFAAPAELLSCVLLCGEGNKDVLRVNAQMPMLEPAPAKLRLALANPRDEPKQGVITFAPAALPLVADDNPIVFALPARDAKFIDIRLQNRDQLQDFMDLEFTVTTPGFEQKFSVYVAPTLPNGSVELDAAGNAMADYWRNSLRDFIEPFEGNYALVLPPETGSDGSRCPYSFPENYLYLLPDTAYTLKFNYRYSGTTPVHAAVNIRNERNEVLEAFRHVFRGSSDFAWQEAEMSFTTPAATAKASLMLANVDKSGKGVNAWIDHVRLLEGPVKSQ